MTKKIAYIITRSEIGGAQNHLISLLSHFSNSFELVLIVGSNGYLVDKVNDLEIKPRVYIVESIDSFNFFRSTLKIIEVIKKEQPDLIHVHSTLASISSRFAAFFTNKNLIYTVHGWHFANKGLFRKSIQISFEYLSKFLTDYWITVSQYDLDSGNRFKLFKKEHVSLIRNGIADVPQKYVAKHEIKNEGGTFNLVFVGRMSHQKNFLAPLEVLARSNKNVRLTMYLAGEDTIEIESKIKSLSLHDQCKVILNDSNPSEGLADYDAMIITSRFEGMPLSVIEGLRAGLPIISTNVCGMNELVKGSNGFLIPFDDINCMRESIEILSQTEGMRQTMGHSSRLIYEEHFMESQMLKAVGKVYEQMLAP